jgi:DNA invertase Pin-like site-specific DNA recombinase
MNTELSNSSNSNDIARQEFARKPRDLLTVGYIRISPVDGPPQEQDTRIRDHAGYYGWILNGMVLEAVSCMKSWKNRKELHWLAGALQSGDRLIVDEFSRLGRSVTDVISLLAKLYEKGVTVCDVKNRWQIDRTISPQMISMLYAVSAQIERGLVSVRTREGLATRKAKGLGLGRKKGKPAPSKLDPHREEIVSLLKSGSTKAYIMKKYATSKTNLYHWLKINKLDAILPVYEQKAEMTGLINE